MNESISTANFLEEDTINGVVKEAGVVTRCVTLEQQNKAQNIMLDYIKAAIPKGTNQTKTYAIKQPFT